MHENHNYIIQKKVFGIEGSPRKKGNSDILLEHLLRVINEQGIETAKFSLRNYQFGSCIGCERCRKDKICTGLNDGMTLLYPHFLESQGLILVSPTHNYNVTAITKAFIDRLYCFYEFSDSRPREWKSRLAKQGRKAIIATICEQENKENMGMTLEAMRLPLEALGYDIVDELAIFSLFDRGIIKKKVEVLKQAKRASIKLVKAIATCND